MCKSTMWAIKGFLTGVAAGMVAGAIGCCCMGQHRRGIKRHIGRALHAMGELADTVTGMF